MVVLMGFFYFGPSAMRATPPSYKLLILGVTFAGLAVVFIPMALAINGARRSFSSLLGKPDGRLVGAPIGLATITGVERTGLSVNGVSQYNVQVTIQGQDGHRFASRVLAFAEAHDGEKLAIGAQAAVKYLPEDHSHSELIQDPAELAMAQDAVNQIRIRAGLMDPALPAPRRVARHHGGSSLSLPSRGPPDGTKHAAGTTRLVGGPEPPSGPGKARCPRCGRCFGTSTNSRPTTC